MSGSSVAVGTAVAVSARVDVGRRVGATVLEGDSVAVGGEGTRVGVDIGCAVGAFVADGKAVAAAAVGGSGAGVDVNDCPKTPQPAVTTATKRPSNRSRSEWLFIGRFLAPVPPLAKLDAAAVLVEAGRQNAVQPHPNAGRHADK